jgi:type III secretion system FlhB-like substrate exporter
MQEPKLIEVLLSVDVTTHMNMMIYSAILGIICYLREKRRL